MPSLYLVCDDAGFACVDRGIRALVDQAQLPVCAEYMIERDGAAERALKMREHPLVSIGLHFELSGISDRDRVMWCRKLMEEGSSLSEQPDVQGRGTEDARRQLAYFRSVMGTDPAHISTHGNFNADAHGRIAPWWTALMKELFGDVVPPMQLAIPHVRHNCYSWNVAPGLRPPCEPAEFASILVSQSSEPAVEFVMHPALPREGDSGLDMLFDERMRVRDLEAAIRILQSDAIERAGFTVKAMGE